MAVEHRAVDWQASTGIDEHGVADNKVFRSNVADTIFAANGNCARQEFDKFANCMPSTRDRHALQDLGDEHKQRDNKRGEEFADRGGSNDGNRHRQFHRHAPREDVFQSLTENRPASDQEADHPKDAETPYRFPEFEPNRRGCDGDKRDARGVLPRKTVLMSGVIVCVACRYSD